MRSRFLGVIAGVGLLALAAVPSFGTQVKIFQAQSQAAFLSGTLEGVSVDSLGRIELAPRVDRVASISEPFLLAAAVHPDGWVVGTGNAGKVLKVDRKGEVTELFAAPEPEVFAVWADPDGTVFAGTSPRGKVYRIPPGKSAGKNAKGEVFFDPGETYIWALARSSDGGLLVGTGTEGKLFRVDAKGKGEVLYDSDDTHVRAVETVPGGDVLAGTAGEGLILRISRDGQARTLYDAEGPEIVSLTAAPDGTCYAGVISSEASLVDQARDPAAAAAPAQGGAKQGGSGSQPQVSVTVEQIDSAPAGSAPAAGGGRRTGVPRSEVLSITPAGVVESLWTFADDTVYDLAWQGGRLWAATGLEGKLYRWADQQMILEKDVDERQIVTVLPGDPGPVFATTNAAAVFRVTADTERTGTYTSPALDAEQVARFGTFFWKGDGSIRFSFRSGVSAEPDRTWSAWTEPREGSEISLSDVPRGRYVQFRAELRAGSDRGGGSSPRIYETELSYRQENLSPKIGGLTALEPGQILVPANFNPSNQVYEPAHPNREGIFTSLTAAAEDDGGGGGRNKVLWKLGFQTLRWSAADPNGDDLVYDLSFRPAQSEGGDPKEGEWLKVVDELKDDYYSFDSLSLPDGIYRFRLRASDLPSNDPEAALVAERVSDPVVVDHAPPQLIRKEPVGTDRDKGGALRVTVQDAASPIREAVYSVNAEEWKPVRAADGLLDGRTEILLIEAGKPGDLALLRVTDAAQNVVTFNLTQER